MCGVTTHAAVRTLEDAERLACAARTIDGQASGIAAAAQRWRRAGSELGRGRHAWYWLAVAVIGGGLVIGGAPSWLALAAGLVLALGSGISPPAPVKAMTTRALQLGVIALGAGMNLVVVWQVGSSGALLTAISLTVALVLAMLLGRWLKVSGDTLLLIGVGTAICGGSAIAAVTTVIRPKAQETSISLAVVFVLNAVGLIVFPVLGHAFGLSEMVFGRWAALGIHDTSSVVGAGLAYGPQALAIATTTKLARALWIVPVTIVIALARRRGQPGAASQLGQIRWPWFILGFIALAALFTWVPFVAPAAPVVVKIGQRALLLALFLIGLSLSRDAIAKVGARPFVLGVVLWVIVATVSLRLAMIGP
jgi:uncharacterized integral membrane protein (TIGR00698 family)